MDCRSKRVPLSYLWLFVSTGSSVTDKFPRNLRNEISLPGSSFLLGASVVDNSNRVEQRDFFSRNPFKTNVLYLVKRTKENSSSVCLVMRSRPTRSRAGVEYPQHMAATNLCEETCSELESYGQADSDRTRANIEANVVLDIYVVASKYCVVRPYEYVVQRTANATHGDKVIEENHSSFRSSERRLPRNFLHVASSTSVKETRDRDEEEGARVQNREIRFRKDGLRTLRSSRRRRNRFARARTSTIRKTNVPAGPRRDVKLSLGAIRKWPLRATPPATPLARLICNKRPVRGSG
ncbi:hypothetical protein HZH66_009921 [Vespula vulgaris]|uniref:Uncharacterized protein n=1 Tax=Vespula vulgaris TaxID=7454 RepID=A0A834JKR2_VESVU|nr:hypothetical protein HZH66_009921 [Vespula vulgaris]